MLDAKIASLISRHVDDPELNTLQIDVLISQELTRQKLADYEIRIATRN